MMPDCLTHFAQQRLGNRVVKSIDLLKAGSACVSNFTVGEEIVKIIAQNLYCKIYLFSLCKYCYNGIVLPVIEFKRGRKHPSHNNVVLEVNKFDLLRICFAVKGEQKE